MPTTGDEQIIDAVVVNDVPNNRNSYRFHALAVAIASFIGALALAVVWLAWPPRMGIRFAGGTRFVYEILDDSEAGGDEDHRTATADRAGAPEPTMHTLVKALARRINPSQTREVRIRPYGERQVEIIVPETDPIEIGQIKKIISTPGRLEFRILANRQDHQGVILLAREMADNPARKLSRMVKDEAGEQVGFWALVARATAPVRAVHPFKADVSRAIIRASACDPDSDPYSPGDIIDLPANAQFDAQTNRLEDWLAERGVLDIDVLMAVNDHFDVNGDHLGAVSAGTDETMRPCIKFHLTRAGATRFRSLTSANLPDKQSGFHRRLGIILNGRLLSAPRLLTTIGDRGQITGAFTQEEVNFLVGILRAGKLPVSLDKEPRVEEFFPPDPSAPRLMRTILLTGGGILLLAWLVMSFRYGWLGAGAALTGFVPVLTALALLQVVRATFTVSLVVAIGSVALLATLCNAAICEFHRRGRQAVRGKHGSARPYVFVPIVIVSLLFLIVCCAAIPAYVVGNFEIRTVAIGLICGSLSALVIHGLMWVLPAVIRSGH